MTRQSARKMTGRSRAVAHHLVKTEYERHQDNGTRKNNRKAKEKETEKTTQKKKTTGTGKGEDRRTRLFGYLNIDARSRKLPSVALIPAKVAITRLPTHQAAGDSGS